MPQIRLSLFTIGAYTHIRQQYRDYVIGVKREFRRVSRHEVCFQSHPWLVSSLFTPSLYAPFWNPLDVINLADMHIDSGYLVVVTK